MSQKNVEIVWRGIQAFNGRDLTRAFSVWSSDAEIDWSRSNGPLKGVYRGHAELERFWGEFWSTFRTVEVKTHGFIQAGADVVIPNSAHLRGRDGIEVVARSTFVYTVKRGQITRLRMFQELADALEAAGCPNSRVYRCGREAAVWSAAKENPNPRSRLSFPHARRRD
jgi:ketosteroid isomerase-like protein